MEKSHWQLDEIHEALGYSRSTLYRYLKTLSDTGLLTTFPGRGYSLGSRIVEFDYMIRKTDPLIQLAAPITQLLARKYKCVSFLCRRYQDRVLCVSQQSSTTLIESGYERGKAQPLFHGAASQVILAQLSPYQLGKLFKQYEKELQASDLGTTLPQIRQSLNAIRTKGWHATRGSVTPGVVGIAAPIFDHCKDITGSLCLTLPDKNITEEDANKMGTYLASLAQEISDKMIDD